MGAITPVADADGLLERHRPELRYDSDERHFARVGLIPGEESSPRGPAFQPERWNDPGRFHAEYARACAAGPPGRLWQTILSVALAALAAAALVWLVIRRSYNRGR